MKNYLLLALLLIITGCSTNKKILMVVTNHETLGTTGKKTGYYLPEVTHPYYKFVESGYEVDFASPSGGMAPMDPKSLDLKDKYNKKFYENKELMGRLENTKSLRDVKSGDYEAIVFAGGHGTMWDFPDSKSLQTVASEIYEQGGVIGAVCHGPAALLNIKLSNGEYLIKDKKVTGFTNEEEGIVKLKKQMPFLLESKLKERGAKFSGANAWAEMVEVDGRLVTGQNPASAGKMGTEIVEILKN